MLSKSLPDKTTGHDYPEYEQVAHRSRDVAPLGLSVLRILDNEYSVNFDLDTILTIISFTAPALTDPWTTQETCEVARDLLSQQLLHNFNQSDLIETVLKEYLRPAFSKSRPKTVTASGRKAEFPEEDDPHRGLADDSGEVKPWKYEDHRAIAVFHWVVLTSDVSLATSLSACLTLGCFLPANRLAQSDFLSKQWPLFIPVLLALLDDGTTRIRRRGLLILDSFLEKFSSNILRDTGLASVFGDAVFPTLHFLPSITPEEESVLLLEAAYTALLSLARKMEPKAGMAETHNSSPKSKLLDRLLRDGVFSAYFHAKDHVRIVEVLLTQTSKILDEMQISAVKHLKVSNVIVALLLFSRQHRRDAHCVSRI